jgi:hypothetical protein
MIRAADGAARSMPPDARVRLISAAGGAEWGDSSAAAADGSARLGSAAPGWGRGRCVRALAAAVRALSGSGSGPQEIFLMSDLQASGFSAGPDTAVLRAWRGVLFAPEAPAEMPNVSVTGAGLEIQALEPGRGPRFRAVVKNHGRQTVRDLLLRFFIGDRAVAQRTVTLRPGEARAESVPVEGAAPGWIAGKVLAEEDAFPQDNERFFCGRLPAPVRVLLAAHPSEAAPFRFALEPRQGGLPRFTVESAGPEGGWAGRLSGADAAFLVGLEKPDRSEAAACRAFVQNGGVLVWVPGPRTDVPGWDAGFFGPFWGDTLRPGPRGGAGGGFRVASPPGARSALLAGVFEGEASALDPPVLSRSVDLRGPAARKLLGLADGGALVSALALGRGAVLVWATGTDPGWSDLAAHPWFPVLAARAALYGGDAAEAPSASAAPGDSLFWDAPEGFVPAAIEAESPAGERTRLAASGRRIALPPVREPGIVRIFAGGALEGMLAVNADPAESAFAPIPAAALRALLPNAQVVLLNGRDPVEDQVRGQRLGLELWRGFLAAALLFLAAETAVTAVWK